MALQKPININDVKLYGTIATIPKEDRFFLKTNYPQRAMIRCVFDKTPKKIYAKGDVILITGYIDTDIAGNNVVRVINAQSAENISEENGLI